jgi:hypothetical protein
MMAQSAALLGESAGSLRPFIVAAHSAPSIRQSWQYALPFILCAHSPQRGLLHALQDSCDSTAGWYEHFISVTSHPKTTLDASNPEALGLPRISRRAKAS